MQKTLNSASIREAMQRRGLSQAQLSRSVGVSRAAVSKWLKGEDLPRPDKLLKLGALLELGFKELVTERPDPLEPIVAFRRKGGRKTKEEHVARAKHMGVLLRPLAELLPFNALARPATLRNPAAEYAYVQRVARHVRKEIGVGQDAPLHFRDLIGRFSSLHAVIVPVLWGDKTHHENALHLYLPDSMTTWVYLNLDSNVHDFKFWMAHELGHVLAPDLRNDEGEDFADAFAQALLFPEASVVNAYSAVKRARSEGGRINRMKTIAREYGISPTTVNLALDAYARGRSMDRVDVGRAIHAASTNFNKEFGRVSDTLFSQSPPSAKEYVSVAREKLRSPFFDALREHMRQTPVSVGFVETVLQLPLRDARELVEELR